jgi:penicillin-binding protein 1A
MRLLRERMRPDPADPPRRWLRRHWYWLALLALVTSAVGAFDVWLATCGFDGCPSGSDIRNYRPAEGGAIVDRGGKFLGRIAPVRRVNMPLEAIPRHVRQAFVATEDRRFYEHNGLDWRGFLRAVVRNVAAGGTREGFSTITMQVARSAFLADRYHGRSLRRKVIELRLTRLIERELTKDQILEHYLNVIYLGNGMNGVEAASRDLFAKSVTQLDLDEAAMLAALPKAPSSYSPRASYERAKRRRDLVLRLMVQEGYVSADRAQAAQSQRIPVADTEWRPYSPNEALALEAVRAFVDSVLPDVLKEEGDVTVHTTIDATTQRAADRAVSRTAARIGAEVEGALVALDPRSGDIRALVPGRRLQRRGFNRVTRARRQPGSAFKPFVYAAALRAGMSPATIVDDEPIEVRSGRQLWAPRNYDDQYMGRVTFRQALTHSLNAATVRVSQAVGTKSVIAAARRNGITSPLPDYPAMALGAVDVTPIELVSAYAPFANGGYRVRPRLVTRIEAADGTVLWASETRREPAMDARDAFEITTMLRSVVDRGTGHAIRDYGIRGPVAGKTGTTNSGADVWFVGYTPSLVAGIWFGYDTPRPMGAASGGRFAAPAWAEFYLNGWREPKGSDFTVPDGMVPVTIDAESGELATEWCPVTERAWFKPGQEPREPCEEHSAPPDVLAPQVEPMQPPPQIQKEIEKATKKAGGWLRRIFRW